MIWTFFLWKLPNKMTVLRLMVRSLFIFFTLYSQLFLTQVEGVIFNRTTLIPESLANVSLVGTSKGCVSNSKGYFRIYLPKSEEKDKQILQISAIGVETKKISLAEFNNGDTIWVERKVIELAELRVYNNIPPAAEIVRITLNKLPALGNNKRYQLSAFYRHYCSEKDVYGRLIEAAIALTDNKGHRKKVERPEDKMGVEILELRKSFDFTKNFDEHEPISIYSTLKYDVMSYTTILSYYPENYHFNLIDTTYVDHKILWVIAYNFDKVKLVKKDTIRETVNGKLYVDASSYVLYQIEESQVSEMNKIYETQRMDLNWKVVYQEYDGDYYLKYVSETSDSFEELRSTRQEVVQTKNHKAHVEMMINDIQLFDVSKVLVKEPNKEFLDSMEYHPDFWKSYTVLEATPLNDQIVSDLSKRLELEKQFEGN